MVTRARPTNKLCVMDLDGEHVRTERRRKNNEAERENTNVLQ
jgi:hypothetical protein